MEKRQNATLKKRAMIEALEKTMGIVSPACKLVDIHRATHYRWLNEDPEYKKEVLDIENVALDFAESKLVENIRDKKESSIFFYLKTKGKKRGFVERQEIQHDTSISSKLIEWTPAKDKEE
tara:strand:+ start:194 stop:556 length:363 start_codon:yes stop_codon:yes gene_type:complete